MSRTYIPAHPLLDHLLTEHKLKNDAELSRVLEVGPPVVSKIRHGRLPVTATLILRMHEKLGVPVKTIRQFVPA